MFAAQLLAGSPSQESIALVSSGLLLAGVALAGIVGGVWLLTKCAAVVKRFAGALLVVLVVSTGLGIAHPQAVIDGLQCCDQALFILLGLCIPPLNGWCPW
jgi:hypothetical protein